MSLVAAIAVGSNLGDRRRLIESAIECLDRMPGIEVITTSSLHETAPVGGPDQGAFLNGAILVDTVLESDALLARLHQIERDHGRVRPDPIRNGPRTLDLDLLLHGQLVSSSDALELPHPRMHQRLFVLEPLVEIGPELMHPVLNETIATLHAACLQTESPANPS